MFHIIIDQADENQKWSISPNDVETRRPRPGPPDFQSDHTYSTILLSDEPVAELITGEMNLQKVKDCHGPHFRLQEGTKYS